MFKFHFSSLQTVKLLLELLYAIINSHRGDIRLVWIVVVGVSVHLLELLLVEGGEARVPSYLAEVDGTQVEAATSD